MPRYLAVVAAGWVLLGAGGVYYGRLKGVPEPFLWPLLAAFLVEFALYILPGFEKLRDELAKRLPVTAFAGLLAVSGLIPYLIYSLGTGQFNAVMFARLAALVAVVCFWYVFRRPSVASDVAMLAILAAVLLTKFFSRVYISPAPKFPIDVLGQLMLIRLAVMVMLNIREVDGVGFGFFPTRAEWGIGLRYFLLFIPIGVPLAVLSGIMRFDPTARDAQLAPLLFVGFFWVLALSEEFFFRGLLQRWLGNWTGKPHIALVVTALIFGACHLSFRFFPNWKFALLSAGAGWFYGKAYERSGSIRAAMVTHALTVTTWRTLFS